jgi:hypothetical protein
MSQKKLTPSCHSVLISALILLFLSFTASAQRATIKIECKTETRAAIEKKEAGEKKQRKLTTKGSNPLRFELPLRESATQQSLEDPTVFPLGCVAQAYIYVFSGPSPNSVITFTLVQTNPANILGFRWGTDPFTPTLQVPVALNASGNGVSDLFDVKMLSVGQTAAIGQSPGFNTDSGLETSVVECPCPIVPAVWPPRNE